MFATIKSLIPEPRQADQPRHYVGRHRQPDTIAARAPVAGITAPAGEAATAGPATAESETTEATAASRAAPRRREG